MVPGPSRRGVYPPASQFEAWFPSLAHSDADLDRTISRARAAFEEVLRRRTARDGALALREALDAEGGTVAGLLAPPAPSPRPSTSRARRRSRPPARGPAGESTSTRCCSR